MTHKKNGRLLLLPNVLSEELPHPSFLPKTVDAAVSEIEGIIAESEKGARAFLRRFSFPAPKTFREIPIRLLNEHSAPNIIDELLAPLLKGETWGLISDCGLPCLADPGAKLIFKAREKGVDVEAFVGPSSIVLALMLSGLSAQSFAFHGYLEKEQTLLLKQVQELQKRSAHEKSTQLFIEAPYRTQKMLEFLVKALSDSTLLCLAVDLTLPTQQVICQTVKKWKERALPLVDKRPAIFLFSAFNRLA